MADINKNIAPIYDASETYDIGTIVNKDNKLYTYLGEDEEMQEVFLSDLIRGKAVSKLDLDPELLWENPSPTSEFAAQTVALDLSEYEEVIIEYNRSIGITNLFSRAYVKIKDTNINEYFGVGSFDSTNSYGRSVSVTNTGVTFGNGSTNGNINNNNVIPTKIYGVKKLVSSNLGGKAPILYKAGVSGLNVDGSSFLLFKENKASSITLSGCSYNIIIGSTNGSTWTELTRSRTADISNYSYVGITTWNSSGAWKDSNISFSWS